MEEWQDLQGEFEGLVERVGLLGEVVQTETLNQQVAELSRHAEELQQRAKTRLLTLQDAAKVKHNTTSHYRIQSEYCVCSWPIYSCLYFSGKC